jgi:hypothetical protein
VPRSIVMKITGHKTETVYRRYAIVNEADMAEGSRSWPDISMTDPISMRRQRVTGSKEFSKMNATTRTVELM